MWTTIIILGIFLLVAAAFAAYYFRLYDLTKCKRKFDPTNFAGAGNVNWWGHSNARKETKKLAKAGIPCYHIELFGWADSQGYDVVDKVLRALDELLYWCKRRKLALFVSVVNDNAHLAKYGNTPIDLNTKREAISKALQRLAKYQYKQDIYVQPVGETQTSAGRWVEGEAAKYIDKRFLVANSNGGRPAKAPAWASFFAWHKAKQGDKVPSGAWDVTDHDTLLNWLGGTSAQTYNNDRITAWAAAARKAGNPAVLYMFVQKVMDESNLRTLAQVYYEK